MVSLRPLKSLLPFSRGVRSGSGRSGSTGSIISRFRGGSQTRRYRFLDLFRAFPLDVPALVRHFYQDPHRNTPIILLAYRNGYLALSVPSASLYPGSVVMNFSGHPVRRSTLSLQGSSFALSHLPAGSHLYCLQLSPQLGVGFQYARSRGMSAQLLRLMDRSQKALVRLKSGFFLMVPARSRALFGFCTPAPNRLSFPKAGSVRRLGRRPHVRGVAMNPVDHPHGGGEGKGASGRPSVSPWGYLTKCGYRKKIRGVRGL
jgi:large subunit ribosomal protein L2